MRKLKLSLFIIGAAILATVACHKTENAPDPPLSKSDVQTKLTGSTSKDSATVTHRKWKLYRATINGIDVPNSVLPSCRRDNTYDMRSDFTLNVDEGPSKCISTDPQTAPGNWGLSNDGTIFFIKTPTDSIGGTVLSITNNSITIKGAYSGTHPDITFMALN
jgi:hypothetical protein